jgi:alpha-beta hydrolase superfamily lysophospholipase
VGFDLKGQGKSEGTRGLVENRADFYSDGFEFMQSMQRYYTELHSGVQLPLIAFCFSFGCAIALGSSRKLSEAGLKNFDGLILTAPLITVY